MRAIAPYRSAEWTGHDQGRSAGPFELTSSPSSLRNRAVAIGEHSAERRVTPGCAPTPCRAGTFGTRACWGASFPGPINEAGAGRSPRVRGSRPDQRARRSRHGSIPCGPAPSTLSRRRAACRRSDWMPVRTPPRSISRIRNTAYGTRRSPEAPVAGLRLPFEHRWTRRVEASLGLGRSN